SWEWAGNSAVHSGNAMLYRCGESADAPGRRGVTVCVNAGHGCEGGSAFQTLSHPDGTPKVTGGSNAEGAVYSTAISTGMTFEDGVLEAEAALMTAMALKEELLADGYDVLMIREGRDVQLDNIARTVIANNCADLHIAIHFDSTSMDKGAYFCAVPEDAAYRAMEPVASHWEEHMALGRSLLQGLSAHGFALFEGGEMQMDLTQTSYSTIPSVDIELGDSASDHSPEACGRYAQALKEGVDLFFENV
ncbi:MAG TPA: N-acetylmuramoyl-L-alanine amidase, partial [Lachnospiraceae bacterium]|nr:N-acetylmuramoyl-L-alanine amidase [Lachnospiraceae bacterium]